MRDVRAEACQGHIHLLVARDALEEDLIQARVQAPQELPEPGVANLRDDLDTRPLLGDLHLLLEEVSSIFNEGLYVRDFSRMLTAAFCQPLHFEALPLAQSCVRPDRA